MLTHRNLMTMGMTYFIDVDPVAAQDHIIYAAPMSHGAGIYAIPHPMAGAYHVVPASGGVDPAELFDLGRRLGPLSTFAAPTIVKRLADYAEEVNLAPDDAARSFKTIVYGGAPMYVADIQRAMRVMGPRFVQIYGQGETPMVATALSRRHLADSAHPRHAARIASHRSAWRRRRCRCVLPWAGSGPGRGRGSPGQRRHRHGWLLGQRTGDRRRFARWLAPYRRRRLPGQ